MTSSLKVIKDEKGEEKERERKKEREKHL
jgi:hypothetical protein